MSYEVEQKFRVESLDSVEEMLAELGVQFGDALEQVDLYLRHPQRDFALTDEALRIRRVGNENLVTYKGPKVDAQTKTRREIECRLADGGPTAQTFADLLQAVGFSAVAEVRKLRRTAHLQWRDEDVEISLDHVEQLGDFIELEIAADESRLETATGNLLSLADRLGLTDPQRRSYLELILAK